MVDYTDDEKEIIAQFEQFVPKNRTTKYKEFLATIPQEKKRYKCHTCYNILNYSDLVDGNCPVCKNALTLVEKCPIDHNGCHHDVQPGVMVCPVCGEFVCTICHDHSVVTVSRITGYMSDISGWNAGKRAEFIDRVRVNPVPTTKPI
jgi:hypothetical protein